ncbi:hypothetical protein AAG570_006548 [Ranatra chinensis]|uniref:Uncharacterized protein n=1 Tax=Ranatra chinensis TaxID=642074 RepID=A0ABD0YUY0_9HEMI
MIVCKNCCKKRTFTVACFTCSEFNDPNRFPLTAIFSGGVGVVAQVTGLDTAKHSRDVSHGQNSTAEDGDWPKPVRTNELRARADIPRATLLELGLGLLGLRRAGPLCLLAQLLVVSAGVGPHHASSPQTQLPTAPSRNDPRSFARKARRHHAFRNARAPTSVRLCIFVAIRSFVIRNRERRKEHHPAIVKFCPCKKPSFIHEANTLLRKEVMSEGSTGRTVTKYVKVNSLSVVSY